MQLSGVIFFVVSAVSCLPVRRLLLQPRPASFVMSPTYCAIDALGRNQGPCRQVPAAIPCFLAPYHLIEKMVAMPAAGFTGLYLGIAKVMIE